MIVVVCIFELHIPFATSLKEKRMVVKSLRDKLRNRFELSAAEVALHDLHQRARIGLTFIALDDAGADAAVEKMMAFVETNEDGTVGGWTTEKLDFDVDSGLDVPGFPTNY
jgi:uncharacterized protein